MAKLLFLLFFVINTISAQNAIVVAGKESQGISYTIGSDLVLMQIDLSEEKEISLGVPKFELEEPDNKPIIKNKKNIIQKIIEAILKIFKK